MHSCIPDQEIKHMMEIHSQTSLELMVLSQAFLLQINNQIPNHKLEELRNLPTKIMKWLKRDFLMKETFLKVFLMAR